METFVVRVWVPAEGVAPAPMRGTVQHVTTGETTPFTDEDELVSLLALATGGGRTTSSYP